MKEKGIDITRLTDQELIDQTELLAARMLHDMRDYDLTGVKISHLQSFRHWMFLSRDKRVIQCSASLLQIGVELVRRLSEKGS